LVVQPKLTILDLGEPLRLEAGLRGFLFENPIEQIFDFGVARSAIGFGLTLGSRLVGFGTMDRRLVGHGLGSDIEQTAAAEAAATKGLGPLSKLTATTQPALAAEAARAAEALAQSARERV